ncbi:MAG TPA: CotH kinase family protein, partial [Myxococcota bacterium]|nr:CotH kinase family protein [Myxococcota bacterium]
MLLLSACAPSVEVPGDPDGLDSVEEIGGVEETVDIYELPADMPTVEVIITAEAMARLDADPYLAEDETGTFVDGTGRSYEVDLNYRGAYALKSVMAYYDLRNWKVKFGQDDDYLSRREWNFNYEPHFRQKLAYDLFRFAGVEVPSAQHVVLLLNGSYQGMYLQYEDPDSKGWLDDSFGDDGGDLYKAATDLPGVPQCFADLTVLGSEDADYDCHYQKKTNHKDAPGDFGVLRSFIDGLAQSDPAWFEESFEVQSFLA